MTNPIVPPGGYAGFSQMTPASRASLFRGSRGSSGARTRKRRKKLTSTQRAMRAAGPGANSKRNRRLRARANAKRRRAAQKMKFGSPAWQKKYKVGRFRKK